MVDALSLLGPFVYAPLPDDVRPYVALMDHWWITDEAASVYSGALAVVSLDCHSPLIAYANGTPALYVRQPQDKKKAHMYNDFGMEKWLMPLEQVDGRAIAAKLLEIYESPEDAEAYLARGNARIAQAHEHTLKQGLSAVFGK
jgi:polysaccharide pyruvyl transferase WcaK-like protein